MNGEKQHDESDKNLHLLHLVLSFLVGIFIPQQTTFKENVLFNKQLSGQTICLIHKVIDYIYLFVLIKVNPNCHGSYHSSNPCQSIDRNILPGRSYTELPPLQGREKLSDLQITSQQGFIA